MKNPETSVRIQSPGRRLRRGPGRGALAAVFLGGLALAAFGRITALSLLLLAGVGVLAAVVRLRRSGRWPPDARGAAGSAGSLVTPAARGWKDANHDRPGNRKDAIAKRQRTW